ncbi:hypothetical protein [Aquabacter sediminis]|uniref:hypothetical protein n=1 Tax=Aquabacter sediminis TaxID=3029197 RepID=UPI00237D956A|nr:hypothetical protein [Aquabacter sp. P-9]MDE1570491.1 hypothetical protein [Aquabacter sp. P-9]
MPLATTLLANAIAWRQGGDVAVITPTLQGGCATSIIARPAQGPCGKHNNGPYTVHWEGNDRDEAQAIIAGLEPAADAPAAACAALRAMPRTGPVRATLSWVENQVHACGRTKFTRAEIEAVIARQVSLRRQHGGGASHKLMAMTVQRKRRRGSNQTGQATLSSSRSSPSP